MYFVRASVLVTCGCLALATSLAALQNAPTRIAPVASAHLDEIIAVLRKEWLFRDTMDWSVFRRRVFSKAGNAQSLPDTYDAIRLALTLLGDKHSHYTTADGRMIWNPLSPTQSTRECTPAPFETPFLPPGVGYVRIRITPQTSTDSIQEILRLGARSRIVLWIVDLRNSRGGNMWPALAGIGPLLGEGTAGFFVDANGHSMPWGYTNGGAWVDTDTVARALRPAPTLARARVAVLTDIGVASSGEAITIAFRGRPNTRSFGTPTCGLSTGIRGTRLANGGAIGFVGAVMADRTKRQYGKSVVPDELISDPSETIRRALAWLFR